MKILFLCNNDLASLFALNLLRPVLLQHQVVLGQSTHVGAKQSYPKPIQQLIDYENKVTSELASKSATRLFNRLLDDEVSREIISFRQLANEFGHPVYPMNQINSEQGIEQVKRLAPDLILSIRFGKILQQPIIEIPKLGVINLHSGLLPNYQGVMATFWAMLNGENEIGCCLHYIQDKQIDAGDIIQQSPVATNFKASYLENLLAIYVSGVKMMECAITKLHTGESLESQTQQGKPSYFGFPGDSAVNRFIESGNRLF